MAFSPPTGHHRPYESTCIQGAPDTTLGGERSPQRDLHHPLMAMLAAVHDTGSISAAAPRLGLSYRHVGRAQTLGGRAGPGTGDLDEGLGGAALALRREAAVGRAARRRAPRAADRALRGELEQAFAVAFDASAGVIPMTASYDDALPLLRALA